MTNWRRERSFDDPSQGRSAMQLIRRFPETSALFRFKRMARDDAGRSKFFRISRR